MVPRLTKVCKRCPSLVPSGRTYCDPCWGTRTEWANDEKLSSWLAGDSTVASYKNGELAKWARDYLISSAGYQCTVCSWSVPNPVLGKPILTIDHIDGNWRNNSANNLVVLCYNCHTLTTTFGNLNSFSPGARSRSSNRYSDEPSGYTCLDCGIEISVGALRCAKHSKAHRGTKIDWPSGDVLADMVKHSSYTEVSNLLGVSDNGVRRRLGVLGYDTKTLRKVIDR